MPSLTQREREVLRLLADGLANEEIGKSAAHLARRRCGRTSARRWRSSRPTRAHRPSRRRCGSPSSPDGAAPVRDLDPDPLRQFARWFAEARGVVRAPEAMALATADASGAPSVRMVLLKAADERGLVVLHALHEPEGPRARRRTRGPRCSSTGTRSAARCGSRARVERVSPEESDAYFATRPLGARVGARRPRARARCSRPRGARARASPSSRASSRRGRRPGAASASSRAPGSSGSTATTACTTASATARDGGALGHRAALPLSERAAELREPVVPRGRRPRPSTRRRRRAARGVTS